MSTKDKTDKLIDNIKFVVALGLSYGLGIFMLEYCIRKGV